MLPCNDKFCLLLFINVVGFFYINRSLYVFIYFFTYIVKLTRIGLNKFSALPVMYWHHRYSSARNIFFNWGFDLSGCVYVCWNTLELIEHLFRNFITKALLHRWFSLWLPKKTKKFCTKKYKELDIYQGLFPACEVKKYF